MRCFSYLRGANFIRLKIFGLVWVTPFFWRYNAAFASGRDVGWTEGYEEYAGKSSQLQARLDRIENEVFEMLYRDEITMSRARELLGETSMLPVRERFAVYLRKNGL